MIEKLEERKILSLTERNLDSLESINTGYLRDEFSQESNELIRENVNLTSRTANHSLGEFQRQVNHIRGLIRNATRGCRVNNPDLSSISPKITDIQNQIASLRFSLQNQQNLRSNIEARIRQLENQLADLKQLRDNLDNEISSIDAEILQIDQLLSQEDPEGKINKEELRGRREGLKAKRDNLKIQRDNFQNQIEQTSNEIKELSINLTNINECIAFLTGSITDLNLSAIELEKLYLECLRRVDNYFTFFDKYRDKKEELEKIKQKFKKIEILRAKLNQLNLEDIEKRGKIVQEIENLENKIRRENSNFGNINSQNIVI